MQIFLRATSVQPGRCSSRRCWASRAVLVIIVAVTSLRDAPARSEGAPLPAPVAAALKRERLGTEGLSVYVHELGQNQPLLALAADAPRNPASTIKLLTTLVGLEELGPAYTWRTEAYAHGPVRDGRLEGDLYLKGYGDPYLVIEHFWRFLRALRHEGLETISGDLVLDQSHFAAELGDAADFDGQPTRAYNVLPRALLVNFQAVHIRLIPQAEGLRVVADPPVPVENRVRFSREPCKGGRGWGMRVRETAGQARLVFDGHYQADCGERELFRVVAEGPAYVRGVFAALWAELGGKLQGGVREAVTPAAGRLLSTWHSPALAEVVRSINKYSNNVMTRQLLLTLGAERYGAPGTTDKGIQVVREWLERRGLRFPELVLDNGAGLSREERISARHLGEVLLAGYRGPYMPEFISALPISGTDGTLKGRFGGPLASRLHLKTGSLAGVRSFAGYMLDAAGRRLVVVYIHNHARANTGAGETVQEALLEWIYRRGETTIASDDSVIPVAPSVR